ncbi:MAG: glycosyltransferase [Planctomycetes bacterium]|nr:glycosyltransferase [Planctomycetota bacterium]
MSGAGAGKRILFVSYDGVLGGPGRSQTIPYLRGYREEGWAVRLLSYEKPEHLGEGGPEEEVAAELRAEGVPWTILPWRRSMLLDFAAGLRAVGRLVEAERPDVLHARSYVPALLCDLAGRRRGARLLFDMRGFWPDERVDGGLWSPSHPLYRLWKRIERRLLRRADGVVVLAEAGARVLREEGLLPPGTPLEVIPCGTDLGRFRPEPGGGPPAGLAPLLGGRIFCFLGATGTWYLLPEMLDFAARAVREDPAASVLFLTEDPAGAIREGLAARGVPPDRSLVARVPHAEVPRWIAPSHAGVFFIRSCRSKKASCPTKLGEFLACGVPVVTGPGVGDVEAVLGAGRAGAVVEGYGEGAFDAARGEILRLRGDPGLAARCRALAESRFDAREGARRFSALCSGMAGR